MHIKHIYISTFLSTFRHTPMQLEFLFGKCTVINFISGIVVCYLTKKGTEVHRVPIRKHNAKVYEAHLV